MNGVRLARPSSPWLPQQRAKCVKRPAVPAPVAARAGAAHFIVELLDPRAKIRARDWLCRLGAPRQLVHATGAADGITERRRDVQEPRRPGSTQIIARLDSYEALADRQEKSCKPKPKVSIFSPDGGLLKSRPIYTSEFVPDLSNFKIEKPPTISQPSNFGSPIQNPYYFFEYQNSFQKPQSAHLISLF